MLSELDGPAYITRQAVYDVKRIEQAKSAIKKAFKIQMADDGYALVELLSACPINWGMDPTEANERIKTEVEEVYPLGDIIDRT